MWRANGTSAHFLSMFNFVCSMWSHLSKTIAKHALTAIRKRHWENWQGTISIVSWLTWRAWQLQSNFRHIRGGTRPSINSVKKRVDTGKPSSLRRVVWCPKKQYARLLLLSLYQLLNKKLFQKLTCWLTLSVPPKVSYLYVWKYLFPWSVYTIVWLLCMTATEALNIFIGLGIEPIDRKPNSVPPPS